jgi:arabinose-5-phosphate isomerase
MNTNKIKSYGKSVIETEISGAKKLFKSINSDFAKAISKLSKIKGKVIITGVGKSGHIASKISSTMSSTGTISQYCSPTDMSHGDLGIITKNDAIIIISNSGKSEEIRDLLDFANKNKVFVIGITSNVKSTLYKSCNIPLLIPNSKEACSIGLAPTTSTTMSLILGDAICVSLMKIKNFKIKDYKMIHPGGALGANMLQVEDIMHTGKKMPIVLENSSMRSVIVEMTKKSFGHVAVKNKKNRLIGIVTDGDLRRHIRKALLDVDVKEIMSSKPMLICKDELVFNILQKMNANKITCLFVVNNFREKKPIGVIHIHDCIRYVN